MILYGTAALAICMLIGQIIGNLLGQMMGIDADIGGVGFAMVLLIFVTGWLRKKKLLPEPTRQGILFWSAMYIPIVIAMSSIQNVASAVDGGVLALVVGIVTMVGCAAMVPLISRIGTPSEPLPPADSETEPVADSNKSDDGIKDKPESELAHSTQKN